MSSQALEELMRHYDEPQWLDAVQSEAIATVGYVGRDFPVELAEAVRAVPVRVRGTRTGDRTHAADLIGREFDSESHTMLANLIAGTYRELAHLVVTRDADSSLRLFYTLMELKRFGDGATYPEPQLFDFSHAPAPATERYNRSAVDELLGSLAQLTARRVEEADLFDAIEEEDRKRRVLAGVAAMRRSNPSRMNGTQALKVMGATTQLRAREAVALLEQVLEDVDLLPTHAGKRIYLTGSAHEFADFYEFLESRGALVVGEDHSWGDPLHHPLAPPGRSAIDSLVNRYRSQAPVASGYSIAQRLDALVRGVEQSSAQGVIAFIRPGDNPPRLDWLKQRGWLESAGIPALLIEGEQPLSPFSDELRDRIDAFLETLD